MVVLGNNGAPGPRQTQRAQPGPNAIRKYLSLRQSGSSVSRGRPGEHGTGARAGPCFVPPVDPGDAAMLQQAGGGLPVASSAPFPKCSSMGTKPALRVRVPCDTSSLSQQGLLLVQRFLDPWRRVSESSGREPFEKAPRSRDVSLSQSPGAGAVRPMCWRHPMYGLAKPLSPPGPGPCALPGLAAHRPATMASPDWARPGQGRHRTCRRSSKWVRPGGGLAVPKRGPARRFQPSGQRLGVGPAARLGGGSVTPGAPKPRHCWRSRGSTGGSAWPHATSAALCVFNFRRLMRTAALMAATSPTCSLPNDGCLVTCSLCAADARSQSSRRSSGPGRLLQDGRRLSSSST